jgi:hypothetical protein
LYDADDDLQDGPPTAPEPLRDLIIAQGMQETGIFVLLFTSDTAAASSDADGAAAAEVVSDKATELGIDLAGLTLFSDDAYLLQAALGEALAPEAAAAAVPGKA